MRLDHGLTKNLSAQALIESRASSSCETSGTVLFAALRRQLLQYVMHKQNNLFELFQLARLFFTREDRSGDFAA